MSAPTTTEAARMAELTVRYASDIARGEAILRSGRPLPRPLRRRLERAGIRLHLLPEGKAFRPDDVEIGGHRALRVRRPRDKS